MVGNPLRNPVLFVALVGTVASVLVVFALRQMEAEGLRLRYRSAAENRIRAIQEAVTVETGWLKAFSHVLAQPDRLIPASVADQACPFRAVSKDFTIVGYSSADASPPDVLTLFDCSDRVPVTLPAATGWRAVFVQAVGTEGEVISDPFPLVRGKQARKAVLTGRRVIRDEQVAGVVWVLVDTTALVERAVTRLTSYGVHVGLIEDDASNGPQLLAFHRSRREKRSISPPRNLTTLDGAPETVVGEVRIGQRSLRVFCLPATRILEPSPATGLPAGLSLLLATTLLCAFVAAQRRKGREVEQLVHLRTRELAAARDEALQAMEMKSRFLANMSHEIRTPMNGVLGLADLLAETPLAPHQWALLDHLRGSARSLLRIVNDILNLARIEAGQWSLVEEEFDLMAVFDDLLQSFSAAVNAKGIDLLHVIDESAQMWVHGDRGRVGQVLANLVGNAVKFTDDGSVELSARAETLADARIRLHVRVTDTGPGIPADQLDLLFQAFTQLESGSAKRHSGTGLGLTIARQLVELMGGQIGVESTPGVGSTFWFYVELRSVMPSTIATDSLRQLRGSRVLLVGSSATLHRSVAHYVSSWQMLVETAQDWTEAVERLLLFPPTEPRLVIADLSDPRLDESQHWMAALSRVPLRFVLLAPAGHPHSLEIETAYAPRWAVRPLGLRELSAALRRNPDQAPEAAGSVPQTQDKTLDLQAPAPRILVVEDNTVNQKVAAGLLRKLNFDPHIVAGGAAALDALRHLPFEAILMDCQMPVLDGFETTRLIRAMEEGEGAERMPIIALTANSMPGDRERCLEAGMDDYLAKPIQIRELEAALSRWVPRPVLTS